MAFCYYNTSSATLVLPPVAVGGELHSRQSAKSLTAAYHRSLENTATHTSTYSSQHLSSALDVGGESGLTNNATLVLFIRLNVLTSPGGVPNNRPCNSTFHVFLQPLTVLSTTTIRFPRRQRREDAIQIFVS